MSPQSIITTAGAAVRCRLVSVPSATQSPRANSCAIKRTASWDNSWGIWLCHSILSVFGHDGLFEEGLYATSKMFIDALLQLAENGTLKRKVDGAEMLSLSVINIV
jgi:hypothetical protein